MINGQRLIDTLRRYRHETISIEGLEALISQMESAGERNQYDMDRLAIETVPSAQPERKPGKWIYGEDEHGVDGYHCDECGFFVPWDYKHKFIDFIKDYHWCPSCGADMRGDDHD